MEKVQYSTKEERIDVCFIEMYRSSGSSRSQSSTQTRANSDQASSQPPHLASPASALRNALNQKGEGPTCEMFQCSFHTEAMTHNNHNLNIQV